MRRIHRLTLHGMKPLALLILALLAGCALPPELVPQRNPQVTYENCTKVIQGKTTAEELRALFGKPQRILVIGSGGEDWTFGDLLRSSYLSVTLTNGVVRSRSFEIR